MTSGKHLGSTPIMTSSIVPLNIHRITGKFFHYLRATWLSLWYGPPPPERPGEFPGRPSKFFFIFWPPILQSKTPIRTPTPPLTCHQDFVLLTYFDDCLLYQGHPTTVFCKISVRRSKYRLKFS